GPGRPRGGLHRQARVRHRGGHPPGGLEPGTVRQGTVQAGRRLLPGGGTAAGATPVGRPRGDLGGLAQLTGRRRHTRIEGLIRIGRSASATTVLTGDDVSTDRILTVRRGLVVKLDTGLSLTRTSCLSIAQRDGITSKRPYRGALRDVNAWLQERGVEP